MLLIIQAILPVLVTAIIGYLLVKYKKYDFGLLNNLLIYIAIPALVLTSLLDQPIVLNEALRIWGAVLIITLGSALSAYLIFRAIKKKHSGLYLPIMFMNTINLPLPLALLFFGNEGLQIAVLFSVPSTILMFTIGLYIGAKKPLKEGLKEVLKLPLLYAVIIGLILNFANIQVSAYILEPIRFVSKMAIPMALLILGGTLATIKLKSISTVILASLIRFGAGFGLGLLAIKLLDLTGLHAAIVLLVSVMPAAVFSAVIADKYKNEESLVSSVVLLTTVLAIIIIPLILSYATSFVN